MSINPMFEVSREPQRPMVAVALCFVVGVVSAFHLDLNYLYLVGGVIISIALHIVQRWQWVLFVGVMLGGATAATLSYEGREQIPDSGLYALKVISSRDVMVEAVRSNDGDWRGVMQPLMYGCDSTLQLNVGDRVVTYGGVKHFSKMRGYIYISQRGVVEHTAQAALNTRANEAMCGKIDRLSLSDEAASMVKAMLLGARGDLSDEVMTNYRRSGAAHLLAVSGLHVGIVALILTLLLTPVIYLYWGNILRALLVVVLVWGYAYVVGMSASVVRAAIMYSVLMLAPMLMRRYDSLNILAFAVVVMTLFNPAIILDVGFQLSVVAVAAILLWALPVWSLRGGLLRGRWSDWTLLPLWIGLCCSVATLPIVSHTFGYFSIFGVVLNPLLLITAYLILSLSLVWLAVGFGAAAPLFRWALDLCVALQNGAAEWAASDWRGAVDFRLGAASAAITYVVYAVITVMLTSYIASRREIKVIKSL